ncbi:hypothetical protein L1994_11440 [Methanomicrobium antiquum]|uniref:CARDB domain-containing protein n=1 Tax=Methanomicrobium antiquum TaxID=487686 RepID=A0AAF0JMN3_9EURY|nr:hypothetical protein [Methanomicrobium antiquum]WFN36730.1 hypothetical protein L1994_11440 [Methanomicrobium antiquum]
MKLNLRHIFIMLIIIVSAVQVVSAEDDTSSSSTTSGTAYSYISVTSVEQDPEVLMYGDTGTITVTIKNTGSESVSIKRAELYTKDLNVLNDDAYDTVGYIGAGNEMQFTFTVKATSPDGIYYPRFYLDFTGSNSLSYSIPVKIGSTGLSISLTDAPEYYQEGKSDKITLTIGNPRENGVSGVSVCVKGDGITSTQSSHFIGSLDADSSSVVSFDVTPNTETDMIFEVTYYNGMNTHTSELSVPVVFGEDKKSANPVLNNVEITSSGSYQTISGDITNAGLEDAKSVVVTVKSPATAVDPYKSYVIGALEADDFSSFDVTFTSISGEIPILISYKDVDGNTYEKTVTVSSDSQSSKISGSSGSFEASGQNNARSGGGSGGMPGMGNMGSGLNSIPVFEILVVIIAGTGLFFAIRKGLFKKAVDLGREKSGMLKKR